MNTEEIFRELQSGDLQRQHDAFQETHKFMAAFVTESISAMSTSKAPVVIAEDIYRLVSVITSGLEKLFNAAPSQEMKTITASLLLQMGSKIGVDHLIKAIEVTDNYEYIASVSLAKMGVREAIPAILRKLERFDRTFYSKAESQPAVSALLSHLKLLGGELPNDLRERLTGPDVHPFVSTAVLKAEI